MTNVNVFYNYYADNNSNRKVEIDSCLKKLVENQSIDQLFVITESAETLPHSSDKTTKLLLNQRPSFQTIFSLITEKSSERDVNVVLNSDCFWEENDSEKIRAIGATEAYCLSRIEIYSAYPLKIKKRKTSKNWSRNADMQDCWIFRGKPRPSMWLDFYLGKPGCDNRIAYEFKKAGYRILNPRTEISIYHYHCTELRRYTSVERVPEPYAFPEIPDSSIWKNLFFR